MKTLLPIIAVTLLSGCLSLPSKLEPTRPIQMKEGSAVDLRTQLDASEMIWKSMQRDGCRQTDSLHPDGVIEKSPDFKAGKGYIETGRIAERWVAHGCGKQVPYVVGFTAEKQNPGGSGIVIYKERNRGGPVAWGIVDKYGNTYPPQRAPSPGQPVKAKQSFPLNGLNVLSPDSEGWVIAGSGSNGITFGKKGAGSGETYGAQAIIFEMPPTAENTDFVAIVKKRIAVMNPPPRYQDTTSSYQYNEIRGYPCVDVRISFNDTAAITPSGKEQLKLTVVALYCRHPVQQQLGFFAAYSHRGKVADDQIDTAATSFIEGVSVSK